VKLNVAHVFVKTLIVTFWFGSPVEITIVFLPVKHALHDFVSFNAFTSILATNAVTGTPVRIYKIFIDRTFRASILSFLGERFSILPQ